MPDEKTFTITQYSTSVKRYLKDKVPVVWVHGVITQLNVRGSLAYITIGQFEESNPRPQATLQVYMWASELIAYNVKFAHLPTPFEISVELKVNLLLEADYYIPFGKFQPKIVNVDENFTLGELAQTRKKIIEALAKDGLLDKNRKLPLSPVPLHIGLITAPGSAAFRDFTTTLMNTPFSFQIYFYGARMQGDQTERTVLQAFEALFKLDLDVVCLVRGGGAKTDLIYFDSENICRAIANAPIPVLTGIGHEIDQSIADLVAHANKITPTDCAVFLRNRVREAFDRVAQSAQRLADDWRESLNIAAGDIIQKANALKYNWGLRNQREQNRFTAIVRTLSAGIRQSFTAEHRNIMLKSTGLVRGPGKLLQPESARAASIYRLLKTQWAHRISHDREALKFKSRLLHSAEPARQLEKGYTIIRNEKGMVIKGAESLKQGDKFKAETANGYINAEVIKTEKK